MITNLNIRGFINYLYLQRNGSNAPQDLLQKWSALSDAEIKSQLNNLYASWNLSLLESNQYEKMYQEAIIASLPKPLLALISPTSTVAPPHQIQPHQTQEARPYVPQKKSNNIVAWLIGLIIIGCLVGLGIWMMKNNTNTEAESANVQPSESKIESEAPIVMPQEPIANFDSAKKTTEAAIIDTNAEVEIDMPSTIEISEGDNQNINGIKQLIQAEEDRNFDEIYAFYSPSMEKYWDINYPTRDELQTRFTKVWQRSSNPKHYNVTVLKLADKKYIASGMYQFFQVKTNSTKTIPFKNIFVFDENGKIVMTDEWK